MPSALPSAGRLTLSGRRVALRPSVGAHIAMFVSALTAAGLVVAACSGGKEDFTALANGVCRKAQRQLASLGTTEVLRKRHPILAKMRSDLSQLSPPADRGTTFARFRAYLAAELDVLAAADNVRLAAPALARRATSLTEAQLEGLRAYGLARRELRQQRGTALARQLGIAACADHDGAPASAQRKGQGITGAIACDTYDETRVYETVRPHLSAMKVRGQLPCGTRIRFTARMKFSESWYFVSVPGRGLSGWAQVFPTNRYKAPYACEDELFEEDFSSFPTLGLDRFPDLAQAPELIVENACGIRQGSGNYVELDCKTCPRLPARSPRPPPVSGRADITVEFDPPVAGGLGSGCTVTYAIANSGPGVAPPELSVVLERPGRTSMKRLLSDLSMEPGFSEHLDAFSIRSGTSLSGPFTVRVDPRNRINEVREDNNVDTLSRPDLLCVSVPS